MPMSDGISTLKRIEFKIGNKSFKFAINPESYTHSKPHRTTAVKTKSRIVVEDFQSDISTITIAGSTGFNPTGKKADRGINKIKEMKAYLEDFAKMGGNGKTAAEDFYFYNYTNDEYFVVALSAEGVTFTQDVNSPLTYRYEIKFVLLRKASEVNEEDIMSPEIGNKLPSITYDPPKYTSPNNGLPVPNPNTKLPDMYLPTPKPYDPSSGNDNIYNNGTVSKYVPPLDNEPINPQAPSPTSYYHGSTALGYSIGYYGRGKA